MNGASIDFTVGSRRLLSVPRDLATWSFSLEEVLSGAATSEAPTSGRDGLRVLSAPNASLEAITARFPRHLIGGRQDYRRHYITMAGQSYESYLAQFSGKTRSTLRRKARKLAKDAGDYTISEHRTPAEIEHFLSAALPLSAKTYQERLLDAGLPNNEAARREMLDAAANDKMRCFLLSIEGKPIAYLSLPIAGRTLIYAYLGYDPEFARLSAGTVLQLEALERLFAEERFDYFDFTEGEGAHKAMFGTDSVGCASFALLTPTMANRTLLAARIAHPHDGEPYTFGRTQHV